MTIEHFELSQSVHPRQQMLAKPVTKPNTESLRTC
jgi:hypothetical protein